MISAGGYSGIANIAPFIRAAFATVRGAPGVLAGVTTVSMKTDLSFKLVAAAIVAGVGLAFVNPARAAERSRIVNADDDDPVTEIVRSGTRKEADGQVSVHSLTRKWDREAGIGTLNEAAVKPDGQVYSREANLTRYADGSVTAKGTITEFDGRTFNYTEVTRRTPSGRVVETTFVGQDGETSARIVTTTIDPATRAGTRVIEITNADGTKTATTQTFKVEGRRPNT